MLEPGERRVAALPSGATATREGVSRRTLPSIVKHGRVPIRLNLLSGLLEGTEV